VAERQSTRRAVLVFAGTGIALIAGAGAVGWYFVQQAKYGPKRSVAVMPFRLVDAPAGREFIGLGLAQTLIERLSQLSSLDVIPFDKVASHTGADPLLTARELGAKYVLVGQVQDAAQRMEITVRLIEAETGNGLWSETFEGPYAALFAAENAIALKAAAGLGSELTEAGRRVLTAKSTTSVAAYLAFLEGRNGNGDAAARCAAYRRALELDPKYEAAGKALAAEACR
jgi:TolB-like protein